MFRAGLTLVLLVAAARCSSKAVLTEMVEARGRASALRVAFNQAADASNRAVMADTDETSAAAAKEAQIAVAAVERTAAELQRLLQDLGYSHETQLLQEFNARLREYRKLDDDVLQLAVENTNLKAQRLSFGPVQEAVDVFQSSLDAIVRAASPAESCRAEMMAGKALSDVREIQVLQARHIAEADESRMAPLEGRMHEAEADARRTLAELERRLPPSSRAKMAPIVESLDLFMHHNDELLALSRRNTNVRSLALSLGRKRTLTAACDDQLQALEEALSQRGFNASR